MNKGKLGITLNTYTIVAFLLAIFGQMLLCGLLVAFVMVKEKDEYTSRQCLTAFFLTFASSILLGLLAGSVALSGLVARVSYSGATGIFSVFALLIGLCAIAVLVFEIIGLVNVAKNREANVPVVSTLAYKAFGYMKPKPQIAPPPVAYNYPPNNYQPGQQPAPPQGQPPYAPPAQQPPMPPQGQPAPPPYSPPMGTASAPGYQPPPLADGPPQDGMMPPPPPPASFSPPAPPAPDAVASADGPENGQ